MSWTRRVSLSCVRHAEGAAASSSALPVSTLARFARLDGDTVFLVTDVRSVIARCCGVGGAPVELVWSCTCSRARVCVVCGSARARVRALTDSVCVQSR